MISNGGTGREVTYCVLALLETQKVFFLKLWQVTEGSVVRFDTPTRLWKHTNRQSHSRNRPTDSQTLETDTLETDQQRVRGNMLEW